MPDNIQICDAFIIRLLKIEQISDKRKELFQADEFTDALIDLKQNDPLQFERIIEEISEQFPKGKTSTIKTVKDIVDGKLKQRTKEKTGEFTDADISSLPMKNGNIIPTPIAYQIILSGAKDIDFYYDEMTDRVVFKKIAWETGENPLVIPKIGSDDMDIYHEYIGANISGLQRILGKGPFPTEQSFAKLDDSVLHVAKLKKIDLYQEWMKGCPNWDGKLRNVKGNCWAVKYLKSPDEEWTYIWCQIFMLALVARCFDPGCIMRYFFVIEGNQKIGKSELCRLLVPKQWHTTSKISDAANDRVEFDRKTSKVGVVELADFATKANEVNQFKDMVSERESTYRDLYTKDPASHPKRHVLIVTTNDAKYLRDSTGETRCLPITSSLPEGVTFDYEGFIKEYPQILAQAIHDYNNGARPNLTPEQAAFQKVETDKRDLLQDNWEYQIVTEFLEFNDNQKWADEYGILTKAVYKYIADTLNGNQYQVSIKHGKALGIAFEKHGYTEKGQRNSNWPDIPGTHKMWWKPGTF
jgi:hypothetical protein